MKIAIVTSSDDRSPRVLGLSLQSMLNAEGIQNEIFYESGLLMRLVSAKHYRNYHSLKQKIRGHYHRYKQKSSDQVAIEKLKKFDAIVFSECSPNAFWRNYYNIEKLRHLTKKPILYYEVYYLGNTPSQMEILKNSNDYTLDRFDWHFSISDVTEIRQSDNLAKKWTKIGLNLGKTNLTYKSKKNFKALIDFSRSGYEKYREEQVQILEKLNIPYTVLNQSYSIDAIREIYSDTSLYFLQFPEAFGVPIAEVFSAGSYVFTPESSWPMSWRLDDEPAIHGPGVLPEIFKVYTDQSDLESQLISTREIWDNVLTPQQVFNNFIKYYPEYYFGNSKKLFEALVHILNE